MVEADIGGRDIEMVCVLSGDEVGTTVETGGRPGSIVEMVVVVVVVVCCCWMEVWWFSAGIVDWIFNVRVQQEIDPGSCCDELFARTPIEGL